MGPGHRAAITALVRLESDEYDSPRKGDHGTVEIEWRTMYDDPWSTVERLVFVMWAGTESKGPYGSGPIAKSDLTYLGLLTINIEDAIVEQARAYAAEDPDTLDAHIEYLERLSEVSGVSVPRREAHKLLLVAGEMRQVGWKIRRPA